MNYGKIGKMKYIEELNSGDIFTFKEKAYLLTSDFKKDGERLSYSIIDGFPLWISSQEIIKPLSLYILDENNNVIPLKATTNKITNIP